MVVRFCSEFGAWTLVSQRVERRLAAILAADIVGYSRLVEEDEAGTLAAIRRLRDGSDRPAPGRAPGPHRQADGRWSHRRVRLAWSMPSPARSPSRRRWPSIRAGDASRPTDRVPDRHQSRRRRRRGRRPARRRRQRRGTAGAALRARRRARLRHRLRPAPGQARPAARIHRRAAGQEHRAPGAGLPGAAGRPTGPAAASVRATRCGRHGGRRHGPARRPGMAALARALAYGQPFDRHPAP